MLRKDDKVPRDDDFTSATRVTPWLCEIGLKAITTFFDMAPTRTGRLGQRSTRIDHILCSGMRAAECPVSEVIDPRNTSDHIPVAATVGCVEAGARRRRSKVVAIRPGSEEPGILDTKALAWYQKGTARENMSIVAARRDALMHVIARSAVSMPNPPNPIMLRSGLKSSIWSKVGQGRAYGTYPPSHKVEAGLDPEPRFEALHPHHG